MLRRLSLRRVSVLTIACVVALLLAVTAGRSTGSRSDAANAATPSPVATSPSTPSPSAATIPDPAVAAGAYYFPASGGIHLCSGVVLHSSTRDLVATAAHCLIGKSNGALFVPGLNGTAPYGRWRVRRAWVDPAWATKRSNTRDFAIVRVAPQLRDGREMRIEDVVRGARLGHAPDAGTTISPRGYPFGVGGSPVTCTAKVTITRDVWPTFACPGFADGTSGGPWFTGSGASLTVVGLVSGLHQGGCVPEVSYSVALGSWSDELLARAERSTSADRLPIPPGDGC